MRFIELDPDQRREAVNTQQRYDSLREAQLCAVAYRVFEAAASLIVSI